LFVRRYLPQPKTENDMCSGETTVKLPFLFQASRFSHDIGAMILPIPCYPAIRFMHWQAATNMEYSRKTEKKGIVIAGGRWWLAGFWLILQMSYSHNMKPALFSSFVIRDFLPYFSNKYNFFWRAGVSGTYRRDLFISCYFHRITFPPVSMSCWLAVARRSGSYCWLEPVIDQQKRSLAWRRTVH
jgi:hypothetical protein